MDKDSDKSAVPPWHGDEYHGEGGSFIFDPKTGRRTRVPPESQAAPEQPKPAARPATRKE